jgi:hypothetical protein
MVCQTDTAAAPSGFMAARTAFPWHAIPSEKSATSNCFPPTATLQLLQPVALKKLHHMDEPLKEQFVRVSTALCKGSYDRFLQGTARCKPAVRSMPSAAPCQAVVGLWSSRQPHRNAFHAALHQVPC